MIAFSPIVFAVCGTPGARRTSVLRALSSAWPGRPQDVTWIEADGDVDAPKVVLLDEHCSSREITAGRFSRVVACTGSDPDCAALRGYLPYAPVQEARQLTSVLFRQWQRSRAVQRGWGAA